MLFPLARHFSLADWFTQNYNDQSGSKLPGSGLVAYINVKTRVLQGRLGKGTQLNIWEFLLRQKLNTDKQSSKLNLDFWTHTF